jgi:multiple sugar transport system ATP-binding protein
VFVARFIGAPSMAVFEASAETGGLVHPSVETKAPAPARWSLPEGPVLAGIRPEDLKPLASGEPVAHGHAAVGGTVALVETLGHEVLIHFEIAGGATLIAKSFSHAVVPRIGDTVRAQINLDKLHLFDAATKERLPDGFGA